MPPGTRKGAGRAFLAVLAPLVAASVLAGLVLGLGGTGGGREEVRATLSLATALGTGDTTGFARATAPRPFVFPRDLGPHPTFRTEWWYFTGNLETVEGRRFGYQLTFFRRALAPPGHAAPAPSGEDSSAWTTRQAYMADFALTDVAGHRFLAFNRFSRAALGLAGARAVPFRVWLYDWSAAAAGNGTFPMRLRAARGDTAIDLVLAQGTPPVLNGEGGLSRKGPEPGNASYYFSYPRLPTRGTVRVGGTPLVVTGATWMDREWGTSALPAGVPGWDWFALQLSDHSALMFFRLRRSDGTADPFSSGTFVAADGTISLLRAGDVRTRVVHSWSSPLDGTRYPAAWRVSSPTLGLDLQVDPVLADQELNLAVRYWEGAVDVRGTRDGRPVNGRGYVELTGYATSAGLPGSVNR